MRRAALPLAVLGVLAFAAVAGNFGALSATAPDDADPPNEGLATVTPPSSGGPGAGVDRRAPEGCRTCDLRNPTGLLSLVPDGPWTALAGLAAVLALLAAGGWYLFAPVESVDPPEDGGSGAVAAEDPDDRDWSVPTRPARSEVERAWRALRERVGADPARTPGEVAGAAVERGLDSAAVGEVTDLFRRVRYGDATPTDRREQRAAAAREELGRDGQDDRGARGERGDRE